MNALLHRYGCPVELALHVLAGKWTPVILARLKDRPLRYGDLRRLIPGLSDKMLSQRLRDLERRDLIRRDAAAETSQVSYRLSPRGETVRPVLEALFGWGEKLAADLPVTIGAGRG